MIDRTKDEIISQKYVYGSDFMSYPSKITNYSMAKMDTPYENIINKLSDSYNKTSKKVTTFRPLVKNLTTFSFVDGVMTHNSPFHTNDFNPDYDDYDEEYNNEEDRYGIHFDSNPPVRVFPSNKRKLIYGNTYRNFLTVPWIYTPDTFIRNEETVSINLKDTFDTLKKNITCKIEDYHNLTLQMCGELVNMGGSNKSRRYKKSLKNKKSRRRQQNKKSRRRQRQNKKSQ